MLRLSLRMVSNPIYKHDEGIRRRAGREPQLQPAPHAAQKHKMKPHPVTGVSRKPQSRARKVRGREAASSQGTEAPARRGGASGRCTAGG